VSETSQRKSLLQMQENRPLLKRLPIQTKRRVQRKTKSPVRPRPCVRTADTGGEEGDDEGERSPDEETKDLPPAYAKKDLMAAIKKMKIEDREELLDQCYDHGLVNCYLCIPLLPL
jgi:hypothetical protein